jgi:hypothetical protein
MSTYGMSVIETVGKSVQVTADGRPESKVGGISIDWATVAAISGSDVTWNDGTVMHVGDVGLRYGQVVCMITNPANDVVTVTGGAGTFTVTLATPYGTGTTTALAFGATAATVKAALDVVLAALGNLPPQYQTPNSPPVSTVTGSAGGPFSLGFPAGLGAVTVTSLGAGGATATTAVSEASGSIGLYGPYDPAATDGRATLTQGSCYVLNESMRQDEVASDHPMAIYRGLVFLARIIQSGVATHTLAAGPTLAELKTAFPRLAYVLD